MGKETEFYKELGNHPPETIELSNQVLMYKNGSTWHIVKKGAVKPVLACGGGSPFYKPTKDKTNSDIFENSAELTSPEGALEYQNLCGNCKPMIENHFDLTRMAIALTDNKMSDIDRFIEKRNEKLK